MFKFIKRLLKILILVAILAMVAHFVVYKFSADQMANMAKNCKNLRTEIEKYDWDHNIAFAIAVAESKCNPKARGDEKLIFEGCYEDGNLDLDSKEPFKGYKQVECSNKTRRTYGYSVGAFQVRILPGRLECDTYDLTTNVKCAYKVYLESERKFTPWSVFLDGKYKEFLNDFKPVEAVQNVLKLGGTYRN